MQIGFKNSAITVLAAVALYLTLAFTVTHNAKQLDLQNMLTLSSATPNRPPSTGEWKEVQIKDKIVIRVLQNMKMVEPIGDAPWYREAYSNRDIELTISYGYISVRDAKLPDSLTLCHTAALLREDPTYSESVTAIDGRQAKLSQRRGRGFIFAGVCFAKTPDNPIPLWVGAYCRDERALDVALEIFRSIRFKG